MDEDPEPTESILQRIETATKVADLTGKTGKAGKVEQPTKRLRELSIERQSLHRTLEKLKKESENSDPENYLRIQAQGFRCQLQLEKLNQELEELRAFDRESEPSI